MKRTLTLNRRQRIRRAVQFLAALVVWMTVTPSSALVVDQPEGGFVKPVCHAEATMLLVAVQFGTVIVATGDSALDMVAAAWGKIDQTPPSASKLYVVIGQDGLVRLFAVNRGCVRRSMVAPLGAFRTILSDVLDQYQEARH